MTATLTAPSVAPPSAGPRRKRRTLSPTLLAFVLVPLLVESFWVFWPALQGVYLSFTSWDGVSPVVLVGFGNYGELFTDPTFGRAFLDTVLWLVLFGGLSAVGGLGMALLLLKDRRGVGFYRAAL